MSDLRTTAVAFVEVAHRIVWCSATTVDRAGRPRSRVLHPIWRWDGERLTGWVGTEPSPTKLAHLARNPHVSCTYCTIGTMDSCIAECTAELAFDDATCTMVWELFKSAPPPIGYDAAAVGVTGWDAPTSPHFVALRLRPWRLYVLPGEVQRSAGVPGALTWTAGR
jgi:hypothetical protein